MIDFSIKNELSFIDTLIKLTSHKIDVRVKYDSIYGQVATFPFIKELSTFDFEYQPGINQQQITDLTTLRFVENGENIAFLGSSGVGKTHLATSICIIVAKKRHSTYFIKCHDLIQNLKKVKLENRLETRIKHYSKYRVLIIDEIGYLPIDYEDAEIFFQLIDLRYEQ